MAEPRRATEIWMKRGRRRKFPCIVEARYYDDIGGMLLDGAMAALQKASATWDIVNVPGALEIPGRHHPGEATLRANPLPAIALGCVIRGARPIISRSWRAIRAR